MWVLCSLLLALGAVADSVIYLPGVAPHDFKEGDEVKLQVNKLTSPRTHLGKDFYSLKFCEPKGGAKLATSENLGEHLLGETIKDSTYKLYALKDEFCKTACEPIDLSDDEVSQFVEAIRDDYYVHWLVDNLPAAGVGVTRDDSKLYTQGFPIGGVLAGSEDVFLYNHARITLYYNPKKGEKKEGVRIVGFDVQPLSVDSVAPRSAAKTDTILQGCEEDVGYSPEEQHNYVMLTGDHANKVVRVAFSYDVMWKFSETEWNHRWEKYLEMNARDTKIHWYSIVNSIVITVFLTAMVAMILVRALYRDIAHYNRVPTDEERAEDREETGWKLVHGDVFRPPTFQPTLFAVLVGTGVQVLSMAFFTVLFSAVGFLSPASEGSLLIGVILFYMFSGILAGYTSAQTHKLFNGRNWQRTTWITASLLPGIIFATVFILNLFVWQAGSVNAIPFFTMLGVVALWLLIAVPLVFVGAYYGYRRDVPELPTRVSTVPKPIPQQPWYLSTWLTMAIGGVLPFGTVFVVVFFSMQAIWRGSAYFVFGFVLIVLLLLCVVSGEIGIVLNYFSLVAEDHRWWWRSWLVPGASGIYLFLYCILYAYMYLRLLPGVPILLFVGYSFLISLCMFLLTGVVGYLATFQFIKIIYGSIKID